MTLKVKSYPLRNILNKWLHRIRRIDILITYSADTGIPV